MCTFIVVDIATLPVVDINAFTIVDLNSFIPLFDHSLLSMISFVTLMPVIPFSIFFPRPPSLFLPPFSLLLCSLLFAPSVCCSLRFVPVLCFIDFSFFNYLIILSSISKTLFVFPSSTIDSSLSSSTLCPVQTGFWKLQFSTVARILPVSN